MKKPLITIALLAAFAWAASAQEVAQPADDTSLSFTYRKPQNTYTFVRQDSPVGLLSRSGNTYFLGNQAMKGDAYSAFLRQNCPAAYALYENGHRVSKTGWSLLGCGAAFAGVGWLLASGATGDGLYTGVYMAYLGGLSMTASVPTLIVGYCRMHDSADIYNASTRRTAAYWSINMHPDGVGLALNF